MTPVVCAHKPLKVIPDQDTTIDQLEAYINPSASTNVRFMIADNPQNAVLYYGPPVAVAAGTQWVQSPAFSFTLLQGQTYALKFMAMHHWFRRKAFPQRIPQVSCWWLSLCWQPA